MSMLFSDENLEKLDRMARENAVRYQSNLPFAHIYFDNFLPLSDAEAVLRDFRHPKN